MTREQRDTLARFVASYEENYAPLSPGQRLTLDALRAALDERTCVCPFCAAGDGPHTLAHEGKP